MPLIAASERVIYKRCIVEAKLSVRDFKLTEQRDAIGDLQHMGTGTVIVTYKPKWITRRYRAGVAPSWPVEFERELKMNKFKTQ